MKLLKMSRGYWEIAVQCKASKTNVLRDYDLLKDRENGKSLGQLEIKYGISRQAICDIISKYK